MKGKHWTLIGGSYIVFAIAVATMAQIETSNPVVTDQSPFVGGTTESPVWRSQRLDLDDANPRRNLFLTIWSTRNCPACTVQEREIPALEEAGYNVVLRKVPAPRWVKSFPATVVTRDSIGGEEVTRYSGARTLAEIDAILKIGETPEEEVEDPEYDIFRPKAQVNLFNLVVWLNDSEECGRQYEEIAELRKKGFSANVYVVGGPKRKPRHVTSFPHIVLIHNRPGGSVCVAYWGRFVTAEEILDALH